jgi:hypothetical protein
MEEILRTKAGREKREMRTQKEKDEVEDMI